MNTLHTRNLEGSSLVRLLLRATSKVVFKLAFLSPENKGNKTSGWWAGRGDSTSAPDGPALAGAPEAQQEEPGLPAWEAVQRKSVPRKPVSWSLKWAKCEFCELTYSLVLSTVSFRMQNRNLANKFWVLHLLQVLVPQGWQSQALATRTAGEKDWLPAGHRSSPSRGVPGILFQPRELRLPPIQSELQS